MKDNLLEVNNLKKYFPVLKGVFQKKVGDIKAVDNISFSIKRGEIFGLVGESGCGKSTTGRTILNLIAPTGGSVVFEGKTIFDVENNYEISDEEMRKLRKDMQIVFQDPFASLDPRMNVGDIISEGMLKHKIYNKRDAINKTKELLEMCGLTASNIKKYPHEFSGGQRQRIGIARSIALNPKFIVGDEPIAALDVSIQSQILSLLQKLIEELNLTFLFISHDLNVVRYFCDQIAVMYLGSFVEVGTSEQLFDNPIHPYTQALLSAVPASMPSEIKKRILLEGDVPSPANPPEGCKFHTRCPYTKEICTEKVPELKSVDGGNLVSCHLYS
ncbi:oligopeptide ABC transporter (ATP-binding protein) [[Clostridium] ultunense Esp]|uniref:Oligopeptide ABC transporter (ATP-binding protein) n=2 Tax=Schnuerera ultunensis TaxID=45497 RepID=M1ZM99_9FIRM|nr:ABC transporter ATP-binding protein [Schnuerera ultunensis]CCQ98582.1 oligopeptide ABC transporter (ATP-binding protein) [[Clostridium] ultunense Esp]SHD78553.1 oligopeptide ABC transporter (ATP-binding protein) [[Clostridium] ultunense Esp]